MVLVTCAKPNKTPTNITTFVIGSYTSNIAAIFTIDYVEV